MGSKPDVSTLVINRSRKSLDTQVCRPKRLIKPKCYSKISNSLIKAENSAEVPIAADSTGFECQFKTILINTFSYPTKKL